MLWVYSQHCAIQCTLSHVHACPCVLRPPHTSLALPHQPPAAIVRTRYQRSSVRRVPWRCGLTAARARRRRWWVRWFMPWHRMPCATRATRTLRWQGRCGGWATKRVRCHFRRGAVVVRNIRVTDIAKGILRLAVSHSVMYTLAKAFTHLIATIV